MVFAGILAQPGSFNESLYRHLCLFRFFKPIGKKGMLRHAFWSPMPTYVPKPAVAIDCGDISRLGEWNYWGFDFL